VLYMQFGLRRPDNRTFLGVPLVTTDRDGVHEGFEKIKSYDTFDVYAAKT
jgi:hypothetical protein